MNVILNEIIVQIEDNVWILLDLSCVAIKVHSSLCLHSFEAGVFFLVPGRLWLDGAFSLLSCCPCSLPYQQSRTNLVVLGYEANTLEGNCTDIDECAEGRDNCTKGTCVNTDGSFFCCNAGFTSTGGVCVDIDECYLKLDNCVERRQCINTYGSFMCCNPGTSLPSKHPIPTYQPWLVWQGEPRRLLDNFFPTTSRFEDFCVGSERTEQLIGPPFLILPFRILCTWRKLYWYRWMWWRQG